MLALLLAGMRKEIHLGLDLALALEAEIGELIAFAKSSTVISEGDIYTKMGSRTIRDI